MKEYICISKRSIVLFGIFASFIVPTFFSMVTPGQLPVRAVAPVSELNKVVLEDEYGEVVFHLFPFLKTFCPKVGRFFSKFSTSITLTFEILLYVL